MRKSITAIVLLAVLLCTAHADATIVLAVRQRGKIVIAADSLRGLERPTGERIVTQACKIRNFGDLVFGAAGKYLRPVLTPDLLADYLLGSQEPIRLRAARFADEIEARRLRVPHNDGEILALNITYVLGFFEESQPVLLSQTAKRVNGEVVVNPVEEIPEGLIVMPGKSSVLTKIRAPSLLSRISQTFRHSVFQVSLECSICSSGAKHGSRPTSLAVPSTSSV